MTDDVSADREQSHSNTVGVPCPTSEEKSKFFEGLRSVYPKSAVLLSKFLNTSSPPLVLPRRKLPPTLMSLYRPKYKSLPKQKLYAECSTLFQELKISVDEACYLEKSTQLQSQCALWHDHRKGRVTASVFKNVCHTNIDKPAKSIITSILKSKPIPNVPAVKWGCANENKARSEYIEVSSKDHSALKVTKSGLHVNINFPHLGASPDGLISCACCGDGLLEIKCPYSIRDRDPTKMLPTAGFYLESSADGLRLSHSHSYYYQVQGQLAVCERAYCDFVCWTPLGMHIERIYPDTSHWEKVKPKLDLFFMSVILPRILSGDEDCSHENIPPATAQNEIYCYCQKEEDGPMIGCDNPTCKFMWFHYDCIGIVTAPEGDWFCPDCTCTLQNEV